MSVVLLCLCFDKSFRNNAESRAREIGEACTEGMNKYTLSVCICVFRLRWIYALHDYIKDLDFHLKLI